MTDLMTDSGMKIDIGYQMKYYLKKLTDLPLDLDLVLDLDRDLVRLRDLDLSLERLPPSVFLGGVDPRLRDRVLDLERNNA